MYVCINAMGGKSESLTVTGIKVLEFMVTKLAPNLWLHILLTLWI